MGKPEIILIGTGGHCRSCIDVIEQMGEFEIAGIIDKPGVAQGSLVFNYPILGTDDELSEIRKKFEYALVTVGQIKSVDVRVKLYNMLKKMNFLLPVIISPLAYVSSRSTIGEGSIVMHHAIVNAGAKVGNNCILNTHCLIEHDAVVGDHTHISTSAVINGNASIGSRCFIGSNSTVVHGIRLPDDYFFRAGKLVMSRRDGAQLPTGGI